MSTFYSDNLNYDIDRYLAEQDDVSRFPMCCECEEPIFEEMYVIDGRTYCPDCIDSHRTPVVLEDDA